MPNITVTVSEEAYRAARVWAAQNDTSTSALVKFCIERLPASTMRQPGVTEEVSIPVAPHSPPPVNSEL
jgi:hypothetical protein